MNVDKRSARLVAAGNIAAENVFIQASGVSVVSEIRS
jgi:hypothetical protein